MTYGHKMELFVLGLSFIGWELLGVLTLGIGYIWIIPYMQATFTNAYKSLKPRQPELPEAPAEEDNTPTEESFTAVNTEE